MNKKRNGTRRALVALLAMMVAALGAGTAMAEAAPALPASAQVTVMDAVTVQGITPGREAVMFTINGDAQPTGVASYTIVGEAGAQVAGGGCCCCQGGNLPTAIRVQTADAPESANARTFLFKNEDDTMSYSTDGGATWTDGVPEGASVSRTVDGDKVTVMIEADDQAAAPAETAGAVGGMLAFVDGTMMYSLDGGESWSDELPEGYAVANEGGKLVLRAE